MRSLAAKLRVPRSARGPIPLGRVPGVEVRQAYLPSEEAIVIFRGLAGGKLPEEGTQAERLDGVSLLFDGQDDVEGGPSVAVPGGREALAQAARAREDVNDGDHAAVLPMPGSVQESRRPGKEAREADGRRV